MNPSPHLRRHGRLRREVTWIAAVALIFYPLAAVAVRKPFGPAVVPAFFSASAGVAVAAAMLIRRSLWPGVVAAIMIGESAAQLFLGGTPAEWAVHSFAGATGTVVGASLTRAWCAGTPDLRSRRKLAAFIAGACVIGPATGGIVGGVVGGGGVQGDLQWWIGDGLGVLVVATPILLWPRQSFIVRSRPWESITIVALTAAASAAAFLTAIRPSLLILPLLAWAALRLDMLGAALAGGVVAFVAAVVSAREASNQYEGLSPFAYVTLDQLFIAVAITVALVVAQEASARTQAVQEREIERRERIQLEGLSHLAQQLSAALTPEDISKALKNHVITEAGAQGVSLGLLSPDEHLVWVAAPGYPQNVRETFSSRTGLDAPLLATDVVRTGLPVMIRSQPEYEDRYGASVRWLRMSGTHSIGGWPLTGGGKPFGALVVIWEEPQGFDVAQVAYLSAVTTLVSQALVRARVYADEHARAAVLQSALVPGNPGDTGDLDVCVVYEPADVVEGLGGDWYDVLSLPDGRMYFAVGDVLGHGLPAVEDMAQLRTAGRTLAFHGLSPGLLLAALNDFTRHASQRRFATMAVAIYDVASGELTYCSAGHPPALLRRARGEMVRLSENPGAVLGPLAETDYVEDTVRVRCDDILVMYTDGLVERRGVDINAGISAAERMIAEWDVESGLAGKCGVLRETLCPEPRNDDVCMIAVRFP